MFWVHVLLDIGRQSSMRRFRVLCFKVAGIPVSGGYGVVPAS
jgi:hypothetical protein